MCCTISYIELGEIIIRSEKRPLTLIEMTDLIDEKRRKKDPKVMKILRHLNNPYDQYDEEDFLDAMFTDSDMDESRLIILGENEDELPLFYLKALLPKGKIVQQLISIMTSNRRK